MDQQPWLAFAMAVGCEVLIGAALGYIFGLFLVPFRIAGEYIAPGNGPDTRCHHRSDPTTELDDHWRVLRSLRGADDLSRRRASYRTNGPARIICQSADWRPLYIAAGCGAVRALSSTTEWGLTLAALSPVVCS